MWLRTIVSLILFILVAPIIIIMIMSFTSIPFFKFPPPGYSFQWYDAFWQNKEWIDSIVRSLKIAFFTTILATIIGTIAANAVIRLNFWGKKFFMMFMVAPMIIPVIIVGIALYRLLAPIGLTGTISGLVLAHSVLAIPIVFVTVMASLKGMDRNLELAAMGLGSTPIGAFFRVTVPYIRQAIFSGFLFAFLVSFDELVVTIFISGPATKTLPVSMWENLRTQVDPTFAAISTILILGIVLLYLLQGWMSSRVEKERG